MEPTSAALCDRNGYFFVINGEISISYMVVRAPRVMRAIAVFANAAKTGNALQVDDVLGQQALFFHGDDQVGAAREKAAAGAVFSEQPARFFERSRLVEFEWFGAFHENSPEDEYCSAGATGRSPLQLLVP